MRFQLDTIALSYLLLSSTPALAHPQPITDIQLVSESQYEERTDFFADSDLWKRKGGGGGGGKGGGGSSSGKGGSSSSGSSGSSGSSSSGSSSSSGKGSSSSSTGGSTRQGSGVQPSYGGGRYYGGGATTPYRSGVASPLGIPAVFLATGALAFYPGLWLYGAYAYPYHNPYTFHNSSANSTNSTTAHSGRSLLSTLLQPRQDPGTTNVGVNETKPVTCLCALYAECGCDDSGNTTFLDALIGNGSYAALNQSLVNVADVNGTSTIVLNGTLPNGTTSAGGTEDVNGGRRMIEGSGYLVLVALVACTVLLV